MQIRATVEGTNVQKESESLEDFINYITETLDYELWKVQELERVDC